jgi:hypothetical protein
MLNANDVFIATDMCRDNEGEITKSKMALMLHDSTSKSLFAIATVQVTQVNMV